MTCHGRNTQTRISMHSIDTIDTIDTIKHLVCTRAPLRSSPGRSRRPPADPRGCKTCANVRKRECAWYAASRARAACLQHNHVACGARGEELVLETDAGCVWRRHTGNSLETLFASR